MSTFGGMIRELFSSLSALLWGWPMIVLLFGTHLFLTARLRFPQRHIFKAIKLSVTPDKGARGDVSQFGALATALAATIGTGNIIGVATAISLGGPGAVLWCWLTGLFGISTKYAEALLAVKYRVTRRDGTTAGGPMYVLERGLGKKWLGVAFALLTCVAAFGIGNTVQANAISTLAEETFGVAPWITGLIVMALVGAVTIGGIKSIARVCTMFVPLMAVLYVLGCITILCINSGYVWLAIKLIFLSAFSPESVAGGMIGGTVLLACRYGIARGLFSNESGLGSAPIVAASAQTRNPVRQALISSSGTFWDTVVICALTGIVIVSCIIAYPDISYEDGGRLTHLAFSKIHGLGPALLTFGLLTFAFSTILGWEYYGEKSAEYLGIPHVNKIYRVLFMLAVFAGAVMDLGLVWDIADCFNALMAIPNLLSLLLLSGVLVAETRKYLWGGSLDAEADLEEPATS